MFSQITTGDGVTWCAKSEVDAEIARLTAERDEAKAVAVWAARSGLTCSTRSIYRYEDFLSHYDGTDADLYRALVEACEGGRE